MTTDRRALTALSMVIVISMMAYGCSTPAAPTATVPPPSFPDGVYTIAENKLKFQNGHFALLTQFDQEIAQGTVVINGHRLTFSETDSAPECGPEFSPYSYEWAFDGKALTFSHPDDKCEGRTSFLMEYPWILQPR